MLEYFRLDLHYQLNAKTMTELQIKIANALLDSKEMVQYMIQSGTASERHVFACTKVIAEKYDINMDNAFHIVEQSFQLV